MRFHYHKDKTPNGKESTSSQVGQGRRGSRGPLLRGAGGGDGRPAGADRRRHLGEYDLTAKHYINFDYDICSNVHIL